MVVLKRFLIFLCVAVVAVACNRGGARPTDNAQSKTATIAPATEQPAPTTTSGSDALTQTTDVEDSRSEGEGDVAPATSSNRPAKAPSTTKAPTTKKHK